MIYYWLKERPQGDVTLEFLDGAGKLVNKFSSARERRARQVGRRTTTTRIRSAARRRRALTAQAGHEPLRVEPALSRRDHVSRADHVGGQRDRVRASSPGKYQVRLTVDGKTQTQSFEVKKDPRLDDHARGVRQAALAVAADPRQAVARPTTA